MSSPFRQNPKEAGATLWVIGWLSSLACLASPGGDTAWPVAASVSLALIAAGLYLVSRGIRNPPAPERRPHPLL